MSIICRSISELTSKDKIVAIEIKHGIKFSNEVVDFFMQNNGGIPLNKEIIIAGNEYEIRCFLSFNEGEYNSIDKPAETFQRQTKGKIIPLAKDSGDNYYCLNIEKGSVYYWDKEDNEYYILADNFTEFISYIKLSV